MRGVPRRTTLRRPCWKTDRCPTQSRPSRTSSRSSEEMSKNDLLVEHSCRAKLRFAGAAHNSDNVDFFKSYIGNSAACLTGLRTSIKCWIMLQQLPLCPATASPPMPLANSASLPCDSTGNKTKGRVGSRPMLHELSMRVMHDQRWASSAASLAYCTVVTGTGEIESETFPWSQ